MRIVCLSYVRASAHVCALAALTALAWGCADGPSSPSSGFGKPTPADGLDASMTATVRDRRLVLLRPGRSTGAVATSIVALGGAIERQHEATGILVARHLSDQAAQSIQSHADVLAVAHDRISNWIPNRHLRVITSLPNGLKTPSGFGASHGKSADQSGTFFFPAQWNLRAIRANDVWKLPDSHGAGTLICDLDTGIDPTHVELTGKVDLGVSTSFVVSEPTILDYNTHGTYVSAIMATNGRNMGSVAPFARLCAIKVIAALGQGSDLDIIAGIVYAGDAHADVANMSIGGYLDLSDPDQEAILDAYQRAADYAHGKGVTLVAAAGNESLDLRTLPHNTIEVPGELNHVISVGATAPDDLAPGTEYLLASYTNFGYPGTSLFAPGGDVRNSGDLNGIDEIISACSSYAQNLGFSCANHETYVIAAGTSASSPHVAAEASIIKGDKGKGATPTDVASCILGGTDRVYAIKVPNRLTGFGFEDVLGGKDCRHLF